MNRKLARSRKAIALAGLLTLALTPVADAIGPKSSQRTPLPYRPGEVLVKYRLPAKSAAVSEMKAAHGLTTRESLLDGRLERLALPAAMDVPGAIAMLAQDATVEYAEPNYLRRRMAVLPNDPLLPQQWGVQNTGQPNFVAGGPAGTPGGDMNLANAWDANGDGVADRTGRGSVIIAIVDDAVDINHPDLIGNLVAGYDFVDNDNDPSPTTADESHGTAVAGSAAAVGNNGVGVTGTAWNEKIMPLRFAFDVASEVRALEFARNNGARIVNASFGGPSYTRTEFDAISALNDAGILFVTSAGNQDSNLDISGASYPANYRLPNVLAVAATNRQDGIASFSTHGSTTVPVAAPGLQIVTTAPNNGYTTSGISGTSFSSPYVAGIAALIRDYNPSATVQEVKARLIEGANPGLDPGSPVNLRTAGGRVDANASLNLALRPSIVIRPMQSSTYQLQYSGGTVVDVPVFVPATVSDNGNRSLDPGETTTLVIALENLWRGATNVRATLSATGGVTVNTGAVGYGSLPAQGTQTGSFSVSVPASLTGHQYLNFTLAITADGGYTATRRFILETGRLSSGNTVTQTIGTGLYDEFHTWTFDVASLPAGTNTLSFQTTGTNDIDVFVRYGQPAQYDVDLDAVDDGEDGDDQSFYYVNVPDEQRGDRSLDGNETINIATPQVGTYYVTVVNYDRTPDTSYTLRAALNNTPPPTPPDNGGGSNGGGGSVPLSLLLSLSLVGLARRRMTRKMR